MDKKRKEMSEIWSIVSNRFSVPIRRQAMYFTHTFFKGLDIPLFDAYSSITS